MPAPESPLWRRAFDDVERRIGKPLTLATSSEQFHAATIRIRNVRDLVAVPIQTVVGIGMHVVGLPSPNEVRELRKQLGSVQRELSAMRRKAQVESEGEQDVAE